MKSITSLLAITVLAAWVFSGCSKDNSSNSMGMSSSSPGMADTGGMKGGMTNQTGAHNMSDMSMAASNTMSGMGMAASNGMSKMGMTATNQ